MAAAASAIPQAAPLSHQPSADDGPAPAAGADGSAPSGRRRRWDSAGDGAAAASAAPAEAGPPPNPLALALINSGLAGIAQLPQTGPLALIPQQPSAVKLPDMEYILAHIQGKALPPSTIQTDDPEALEIDHRLRGLLVRIARSAPPSPSPALLPTAASPAREPARIRARARAAKLPPPCAHPPRPSAPAPRRTGAPVPRRLSLPSHSPPSPNPHTPARRRLRAGAR